jgi:hypothetical protein
MKKISIYEISNKLFFTVKKICNLEKNIKFIELRDDFLLIRKTLRN